MPQFMLLIHEGDHADLSPNALQGMVGKMGAWAESLQRANKMVGANKLTEDGGVTLRKRNGQFFVDGPYAESKEAIGGYFTIKADTYEEAAEIAKECPAFGIGNSIEIRQLDFVD